jgi:hypothetical protein
VVDSIVDGKSCSVELGLLVIWSIELTTPPRSDVTEARIVSEGEVERITPVVELTWSRSLVVDTFVSGATLILVMDAVTDIEESGSMIVAETASGAALELPTTTRELVVTTAAVTGAAISELEELSVKAEVPAEEDVAEAIVGVVGDA